MNARMAKAVRRTGAAEFTLIAAAIAVLLLGGCLAEDGKKGSAASGATATWTTLTASGGALAGCSSSGCHDATTHKSGLNLEADQYATVTNAHSSTSLDCSGKVTVEPGAKSNSCLYIKITTGSMASNTTPANATVIGDWIDAGALQ